MLKALRILNVFKKFNQIENLTNHLIQFSSVTITKRINSNNKITLDMADQQEHQNGNTTNNSISTVNSSRSSSSSSSALNSTSQEEGIIKFLELVGNLKHIKRTGWVMRNVKDCETVAGHMYRMSLMTFLLNENKDGLDRSKCLELALVHDLAESIVGDITPYCGISREEKKEKEMTAMHEIAKLINNEQGERLLKLFIEYEEGETPESKFVKDLDRLDMVLQAYEYEKRDNCPQKHQEFFDSTDGKFNHPFVVGLVKEIQNQRNKLLLVNGGDKSIEQPSSTLPTTEVDDSGVDCTNTQDNKFNTSKSSS